MVCLAAKLVITLLTLPIPQPTPHTLVNESSLSRAFARPDPSAHRSVGTLTAGGAISGKFRYRIDPSCVTAAPFVPLNEVCARICVARYYDVWMYFVISMGTKYVMFLLKFTVFKRCTFHLYCYRSRRTTKKARTGFDALSQKQPLC